MKMISGINLTKTVENINLKFNEWKSKREAKEPSGVFETRFSNSVETKKPYMEKEFIDKSKQYGLNLNFK
jgi:hypothetical protein